MGPVTRAQSAETDLDQPGYAVPAHRHWTRCIFAPTSTPGSSRVSGPR